MESSSDVIGSHPRLTRKNSITINTSQSLYRINARKNIHRDTDPVNGFLPCSPPVCCDAVWHWTYLVTGSCPHDSTMPQCFVSTHLKQRETRCRLDIHERLNSIPTTQPHFPKYSMPYHALPSPFRTIPSPPSYSILLYPTLPYPFLSFIFAFGIKDCLALGIGKWLSNKGV